MNPEIACEPRVGSKKVTYERAYNNERKARSSKKAADWGKEQKEKQKRNDEIGKRLWKKIFSMLVGGE